MPFISYEPLWRTMKEKSISQYQLINNYNISPGTLNSLRKNQNITLYTLHDLCQILNCEIADVVEFPDIVVFRDASPQDE